MKKLTSIALAIVMIASVMLLTACGGKSAYQIYTEAFEKTKALESAEFTSSLTASFEKDGEQQSMTVNTKAKTVGIKNENPVSLGEVECTINGATVKNDVYNADGTAYVNIGGTEKEKMDIASDDALMFNLSSMIKKLIVSFTEDDLKDVPAVKNEDGTFTIDFVLTPDRAKEFYADAYDSFVRFTSGGKGNDTTATFTDAKVSVKINAEGFISSFGFEFAVTSGKSGDVTGSAKVEFINPGTEVTADAPEDIGDYITLKEGYNAYIEAVRKTKEPDSIEYTSTSKSKITATGVSLNLTAGIHGKIVGRKSKNPVSLTECTIRLGDEKVTSSAYVADGIAYVSSEGEKMKIDLSDPAYDKYIISTLTIDDMLFEFSEDTFENATVVKAGKEITITGISLTPEQFFKYFEPVLQTAEDYAGVSGHATYEASDISVSVVINDGYVGEFKLSYTLLLDVTKSSGDIVSTKLSSEETFKLVNPGAEVKIEAPSDLDEYSVPDEAYNLLMAALENTDSLDSVEYSSSESVTTKAVGEEETSYTKYRAKFSGLNGSNLKGSGTITSASKGKTGEMFIYRTADAEYVSVGDQKVKFPIYGEEDAYLPLPSVVEITDGIEKMVDEAEVRRNSDGSIDLVVDISEEMFYEHFGHVIEAIVESYNNADMGNITLDEIWPENAALTIHITSDGYFASYSLGYTIKTTLSYGSSVTVTAEFDFESSFEVINPGKTVTVDVPSDLDKYVLYNR